MIVWLKVARLGALRLGGSTVQTEVPFFKFTLVANGWTPPWVSVPSRVPDPVSGPGGGSDENRG